MDHTEEQKAEAWQRATLVKPDGTSRKDRCSAWMQWTHFGDTSSDFGWVIDTDTGEAVHHRNLSDCAVIGNGFENVPRVTGSSD